MTSARIKLLLRSFRSVWLYSFIGIMIAFLMLPIINLISVPETSLSLTYDEDINIVQLITFFVPNTISIFASKTFLLSVIVFGFIFGFVGILIKKTNQETFASFSSFINSFKFLIDFAFSKMIYIVPFVIFSWVPLIFTGQSLLYIDDLILFILIFLAGLFVIYLIQLSFLRFSKKKLDYRGINRFTLMSTFTSSNGTIPHFEEVNKGTLSNSSKMILALSTTSGQSITGGFSPTFIILITMSLTNQQLDLLMFFEIVVLVSLTSFITVGVIGGDYITTTLLLGIIGLPISYLATIFMIEPVVYPFKSFVNTNGIITNAYRNNKYR